MSSDPSNSSTGRQKTTKDASVDGAKTNHLSSMNGSVDNSEMDDEKLSDLLSHNGTASSNSSTVAGAAAALSALHGPNATSKPPKSLSVSIRNNVFRIVCLDIPFITVLVLFLSIHHVHWLSHNYLVPLNNLQYFDTQERDITYYHRVCTKDDQTTHDTADLLVDIGSTNSSGGRNTMTNNHHSKIEVAVQKMLRHGVTIIPDLISESTARHLREYILEQNKINDHLIFVIENQFRWSFPIQVDQDPIIARALEEILNNPNLVSYLEAVMGSNPAVIEFTAITQAYGAKEQFWHQDVVPSGSAVKYGRKYIPSYSLFIPLQNVTAEMGATGICPGTHMCSESDFCKETGFQTSGRSNNWPLGYGAFVNQQTTHRGSAHRDLNGPHRVVFILTFAPRPLTFTPHGVETRLIGTGGSYSLHWSQWGHTVHDYQNPLQRMKQPYRSLRSLGLYNSIGVSNWGWDYVTVSSARIANQDVGFTPGDLEDFLSKGGFKWIPMYLQGNTTIPSDDDEFYSYGWVDFLLETITKCKSEITKVYYASLGGYIGCILLFAGLAGRGFRRTSFGRNLFRVCVFHLVLLSVAWFVRRNVIDSSWGRNITSQRSFRLSSNALSLAPSLPATLPTDNDVFIFEGMQSESFSSFSRVLETFHPGNRWWNDLVDQMSPSYERLSSTLQKNVRSHMLRIIEEESRRILIQTEKSDWATSTPEMRHVFCHKMLLQRSNHFFNHILQSLDNVVSEIRYGYWRDTILYRKHISRYVLSLRNDLLRMKDSALRQQTLSIEWHDRSNTIGVNHSMFSVDPHGVIRISHMISDALGYKRHCNRCIPSIVTTQPFDPPAWLNVGDIAEASYFDDKSEWYRCTIAHASADRGVWDVVYADGDDADNLCRNCVRPFIPYAINETIDVLIEADLYVPCFVMAVRQKFNDLVYDVQLKDDSNNMILNVPAKGLRRKYRNESDNDVLPPGTHVMALYRDDDGNAVDYFPGRIIQYNAKRNSYDVEFDDGDVAYHIGRHELMTQS